MAKKPTKANPKPRQAVATPPPPSPESDGILAIKEKKFALLYEGLNTKEEILKRWEDEIIAPIYEDRTLLTREHRKSLVSWWKCYKRTILTNDHETVETVILKVRTDAFIDTLRDVFHPVRYSKSVFTKVYELINGLWEARQSANLSDEVE